LDDYAAENAMTTGYAMWALSLPDDVQLELVSSRAGVRTKVDWLVSIGFAEATHSKVEGFVRHARSRPTA